MADSDKNILIAPNVGASAEPTIEFTGKDNTPVTLRVLDDGTVSFEGTAGQLFSVSDGLSGTIFSVNDISGIPSIEVLDTGLVKLAEYDGNVAIGKSSASTTLDVDGTVTATLFAGSGSALTGIILDDSGVSASTYGSASQIPVLTINSKGIVTSASVVNSSGGTSLPDQTGNSGKYLTTNGTAASWDTIDLGTDTTGNYVATITGTANEIDVTGSGSENAAVTIGLPDTINANTTGSAAKLTTSRAISLTGDVTGTTNFDGSASAGISTTLANSGVSAGTYGSASAVSTVTVDAKGRTTSASATPIAIAQSAVTNLTTDLSAKAPLASPALTGTPTSPTAAVDTNTTQIATTAYVVGQGYLKSSTASSTYQPLDADLTAIGALSGTSGFLKKTASNTWSLDTSTYITGNQTITVSGDASGSGTTSINLTLANSGVSASTYGSSSQIPVIAVDAKGRITSASVASVEGLPSQTGNSGKYLTTNGTSASWDTIDLGTDTTGNYVATITGTTNEIEVTGSGSENASVTLSLPSTINANTTGSAASLTTARAISLGGDLSGSASFNGEADITITATVADDSHNHIISNIDGLQTALDAKAPLASPALSGTPTAPTASASANSTQIATTAFVQTAVSNLISGAPGALDTLDELAAALGDDANFASTVTNSLAGKQPLDADLTAIAALSGTSGFLKKTAADTWSLDTNTYLTGNQSISITGDATGSGTTSISLTLANSGVSAGTYRSVTVDAKGRVTAGTNPTTLSGYGITDALSNSATSTQSGYFGNIFLYDDSTPSHYLGITNSANLTAARTLSINVNDADRTVSLSGNLTVSSAATVSGTNTGDQTITLTGDVTGSGSSSFATTLANSGVSAGTYGSASTVSAITVDAKGRITSASSTTIAISQSAVANLTNDLSAKAPLASPALSGTPTAPTAAVGTNTTQIATTAFVNAEISNDAILKSGGTMTGTLILPASTTTVPSIRVPHGTAPTSPTNGDIWTTTAGLFARINGVTVGPFGAGGGSVTISQAAPSSPSAGDLWFDSDNANMYIYYDSTWVQVGGSGGSATTTFYQSSAPSSPFIGDIWVDTDEVFTSINSNDFMPKSGGTFTGAITFNTVVSGVTPTLPAHLATKSYVDNNAAGFDSFFLVGL